MAAPTATGYQTSTQENPIFQFQAALNRYPGNNKQWWAARAETDDATKTPPVKQGDFLPDLLNKFFGGNNRAPRGHYILDAFRKDRSFVSGISDIPVETSPYRPSTISFFSGRVWYGAGSNVYYSQILDAKGKVGFCYQEADPTSEDISDLIASDGGIIPIPEADKIVKLVPISNGMMVFAMNGVWHITGGNGGFTALDISVVKVSAIGTKSPMAIVVVDDMIFWWSSIGIQALQQASGQFGPIPGKFGNTNVTEQTIQSVYNGITEQAKTYAKGAYDPANNLVYWLYADEDIEESYRYNNVILFDVTLQAFYTWKFSGTSTSPRVSGVFLESSIVSQEEVNLVVASGVQVTAGGVPVQSTLFNSKARPSNITYTTVLPSGNLTFSKVDNTNYADWEAFGGGGLEYESFVETGFELLNDAMRRKQAVYVFCYFRRTEEDPIPVASSCTFKVKWDWSANSLSNKWSRDIEAYRPRLFIKDAGQPLEEAFPVVISKNKVRGSGKSIQFRFGTSTKGKTFDLLGWSVPFVGNTDA